MMANDTLHDKLENAKQRLTPGAYESVRQLIDRGAATIDDFHRIVGDSARSASDREIACWIVSEFDADRAPVTLRSAIRDGDPRVRGAAVRWLGDLADTLAYEAIVSVLHLDPEASVRTLAAAALGALGDRRAVTPLVGVLGDRTNDSAVRGEAAEALGYLGDLRALRALIAALADPADDVRFWAAFALGALGDERAIPALQVLADTDTAVVDDWGAVAQEALDAIAHIREGQQPGNDTESS